MITINSVTDLRNWVVPTLGTETNEEADMIVAAIQREDHPDYGSDWSEFLAGMFPEDSWVEKKAEILG